DVALRQGPAAYVPMQLDEPTTQLLTPASRQLRDGALELLDVDGAYVHRRREVEVEAGVLLVLGQRQTVVAGIGPQPSLEELLYRPPDVGVEALTRHDHHREDPALEGVGPQTQPCAALLLDREDRADVLVELFRVGAEQLLARQRVECRHDGLVVVAARYGLVELQHLAELPSEYGDRFDRRVLRLAGEQAEEAALAYYLALV